MTANVETLKEVLRLVVFAAVAAAITVLINYVAEVPETTVTAIILLLLRAADKWVHESELKHNGIVPF